MPDRFGSNESPYDALRAATLGSVSRADSNNDLLYLRLDATNDPVTGALDIQTDSATALRVLDSGNGARLTVDTLNAYNTLADNQFRHTDINGNGLIRSIGFDGAGRIREATSPLNANQSANISLAPTNNGWLGVGSHIELRDIVGAASKVLELRMGTTGAKIASWSDDAITEPRPIEVAIGPDTASLPIIAQFQNTALDSAVFVAQGKQYTGVRINGTTHGQLILAANSIDQWSIYSQSDHLLRFYKFDGTPGDAMSLTNAGVLTTSRFISTIATGTAPLDVSSTTLVTNLNADLLDGLHASAFPNVGAATAQYQYIVTGAGPTYTPAWSGGFLNITTAKTLAVTGTLTLTPSSDGLTLTVPATGTALLRDATVAAGRIAFGVDANTVGGEDNLFWDSTNNKLGIGWATPTTSLSISGGDPSISQRMVRTTGGAAFTMFALSSYNSDTALSANWGEIGVFGSMGSGVTPPTISYMYFGSAPNTAYNINALQIYPSNIVSMPYRLGIGTDAPLSPLTVVGGTTGTILTGNDGASILSLGLDFTGAGGDQSVMQFIRTSAAGDFRIKWFGGDTAGARKLILSGFSTTIPIATFDGSTNSFGIGTESPAAALHVLLTNSTTNAVDEISRIAHNSSGTPAAGFGARQLFTLKSSTTADQSAAALDVSWSDATHASRKARILGKLWDTAERKWLQVDTDGSSTDVLIDSLIYGSMYADDITQSVTIGSAGAYVKVPGSMTAGTCNGFTLASSRELTCTVAGTYLVNWGMSISPSANNEKVSGAAMVNTTEAHQTEGSAECINTGKPVHVSGSGFVTLAVNDVVALCVENEDAAHDITVYHANLTLVRVGV